MLKEGKFRRVSTYRVWFYHLNTECHMDIKTNSAQEAVNTVRNEFGSAVKEIVEVAKVVNNWK